jgi:hypothetical protein
VGFRHVAPGQRGELGVQAGLIALDAAPRCCRARTCWRSSTSTRCKRVYRHQKLGAAIGHTKIQGKSLALEYALAES